MDIAFPKNLSLGLAIMLAGSDIKTDDTFFTAICLSLFNGDCFYNVYTKNKTDNSFVEALFAPINVKNLSNVQTKAENLLKWLIDTGAVKAIDVFAYGDKNGKINVDITVTEPDSNASKYAVVWENERIYLKGLQNG